MFKRVGTSHIGVASKPKSSPDSKQEIRPDVQAEPTQTNDWDAQARELAETSKGTCRHDGYRALIQDRDSDGKPRSNVSEFSIGEGYKDHNPRKDSLTAGVEHFQHEGKRQQTDLD